MKRQAALVLCSAALAALAGGCQSSTSVGWTEGASRPVLSDDAQAAVDRVTPEGLSGHLSFIASDALGGRDTPSQGLDLAGVGQVHTGAYLGQEIGAVDPQVFDDVLQIELALQMQGIAHGDGDGYHHDQ